MNAYLTQVRLSAVHPTRSSAPAPIASLGAPLTNRPIGAVFVRLQLGYVAFGKCGQLMVDVSLVLSQLSFCCGYFIFLALNIPSAMPVPVPGSPIGILLTPNAIIAIQVCGLAQGCLSLVSCTLRY